MSLKKAPVLSGVAWFCRCYSIFGGTGTGRETSDMPCSRKPCVALGGECRRCNRW
jgi:hypothetical protein